MSAAVLFFDLGSPYAYLALERAPALFGSALELEPILLGALFARRGFGSWAATAERAPRQAELQDRARRYGLPALRWPAGWPANGLSAMRAATWAKREGRAGAFARAIFHREFVGGEDIADPATLRAGARDAGLDPDALAEALVSAPIKQALRAATDRAWELGVRGVPSVLVAGEVFFGDDRLDGAAAAVELRGPLGDHGVAV